MKKFKLLFLGLGIALGSLNANAQGGCSSLLESIESASMEEVAQDYRRLLSYKNPYCDTTGSDFEQLMKRAGVLITEAKVPQSKVVELMGEPYYQGMLSDYEKQKLTLGRDGKPTGKALPPLYKIPTGEYYIVYFWRNKDYLVFACKGGKVSESRWWEKGNFR
jgi:hypothetical protein